MRSGPESINEIVKSYKQLMALEAKESSFSSNRVALGTGESVSAERSLLIEGTHPETPRSRTDVTLDSVATVLQKRVRVAKGKQEYGSQFVAKADSEWKAKQDGVLKEIDVSPVEVAFIFGYTTDKTVRELRIRNGRDQHTGRVPLKGERPLTSRRVP